MVFGVAKTAAMQMSAKEAPCANAWEEATLLVERALTPRGHGSPCDWYAKATASTIQWANLCLETAFPFCCPPWQTKSCSELLTLQVRSTYMCNVLTGHSNAKAGSASSEGSACRFTTWSRKGPLWSPARTIERSQEGTRGGLEGFILLAPFRDLTMRSCFPRDRPSTASWWAAIAATYTFKVEGDSLRSNLSCRKESTTPIVHLRESSRRRTPGREQTPFQCVGLPCWRSFSLNDGLYHCRW